MSFIWTRLWLIQHGNILKNLHYRKSKTPNFKRFYFKKLRQIQSNSIFVKTVFFARSTHVGTRQVALPPTIPVVSLPVTRRAQRNKDGQILKYHFLWFEIPISSSNYRHRLMLKIPFPDYIFLKISKYRTENLHFASTGNSTASNPFKLV